MNEGLVMVGKKFMGKMLAQEFCFKEVQGVDAGMVQIQVEALHEEQMGSAVRSGSVFWPGWDLFLNEDWDELCFAKENVEALCFIGRCSLLSPS